MTKFYEPLNKETYSREDLMDVLINHTANFNENRERILYLVDMHKMTAQELAELYSEYVSVKIEVGHD